MAPHLLSRLSVYLGMFCNAIAFTVIFPFGSMMVQDFGIAGDRSSTGLWVGILGSTLMLGRFILSPLWGSLCDKHGRRPIFLIGLAATTFCSIFFGLSQNYFWALVSRALIGGLCCISLVSNTIICELTRSDPGAMAWLIVSWQLGGISGNMVGGALTAPNASGLTDWWVFDDYPYLLPNLVVSGVSFISLLLSYFSLSQTLVAKEFKAHSTGFKALLKDKTVRQQAFLNFVWCAIESSYHQLVSLWCWADKKDGGFGMAPSEIGNILGLSALALLIFELPAYKLLRSYMNIVTITRYLALVGGIILMLIPMCSLFNQQSWIKYSAIGFATFVWYLIAFIISANISVMQNNLVANEDKGKMNGISLATNSAAKIVSPLLFNTIFSVTAKSGWKFPFNYALSFFLMGVGSLICAVLAWRKELGELYLPYEERQDMEERLLYEMNNGN